MTLKDYLKPLESFEGLVRKTIDGLRRNEWNVRYDLHAFGVHCEGKRFVANPATPLLCELKGEFFPELKDYTVYERAEFYGITTDEHNLVALAAFEYFMFALCIGANYTQSVTPMLESQLPFEVKTDMFPGVSVMERDMTGFENLLEYLNK